VAVGRGEQPAIGKSILMDIEFAELRASFEKPLNIHDLAVGWHAKAAADRQLQDIGRVATYFQARHARHANYEQKLLKGDEGHWAKRRHDGSEYQHIGEEPPERPEWMADFPPEESPELYLVAAPVAEPPLATLPAEPVARPYVAQVAETALWPLLDRQQAAMKAFFGEDETGDGEDPATAHLTPADSLDSPTGGTR
jgi:hypothetical protein